MSLLMCEISKEEVFQAVVNDVGESKDFHDFKYSIVPASKEPLGFMGEHVRIIVETSINNTPTKLQYFAKKIPTKTAPQKEYAEKTRAFYKEIELYKTLFEDMHKALSPTRRHLKWRPICHLTRDWDLLIVEDLSLQGYYMLPERTLIDLQHLKVAIKTMARMHAGSMIFEEKLRTGQCTTQSTRISDQKEVLIKDLYPNLIFESECTDDPSHPGHTFWEVGIKSQCAIIDLLPGYTPEQKERIRNKFPDTIRQVYRMLEPSTRFRNVMIHADLWGNNILFRKGEDDQVIHAITVDFQMSRYAPPAQDLLMVLHIVQSKQFRDAHEKDLLNLYYQHLKEELSAEKLEVEELLSEAEFEESCLFYKRYAILNQMIYIQLNLVPPKLWDEFMDTSENYNRVMYEDRSNLLVESFKTDELCRERATEAMQEIIEMYHLHL